MFHMKHILSKMAKVMDILKVKNWTFVSNTHSPQTYPQI